MLRALLAAWAYDMTLRALQVGLIALIAIALAGAAAAQSSGGAYAITREVIAGGGARATGGAFAAVTTTAQPVLGTQSGGDFVLRGGFHVPGGAATPAIDTIFADGFEN